MINQINGKLSSVVAAYNNSEQGDAVDNNQSFNNMEIAQDEEIDQVQLEKYVIQAALFSIPSFLGRFGFIGHDFWLLVEKSSEKLVAALHGLAASRTTGKKIPIGYRKDHTLRVYHCVYDEDFAKKTNFSQDETFSLPLREVKTIEIDRGENALQRWQQAVDKIPELNEKNLDYPFLGLGFSGKPVNSNSAYRTFGEIMSIKPYKFPNYWQPGWHQSMISEPAKPVSNNDNDSQTQGLLNNVNALAKNKYA